MVQIPIIAAIPSELSVTNDAAWLLLAALFVVIASDLRRDPTRLVSARNVVLMGTFAWYLLEALQLPMEVRAYGADANRFALILVGLTVWGFLYGYRIGRWRLFDAVGTRIAVLEDPRRQLRVLVLAAAIGFLPVILYGGVNLSALARGILGMRQTWGGPLGRGALGDFRGAVLLLETCVEGVSWLAVLFLLNRRNSPGARLFALSLVLWTLLRAYGSGTRASLLAAVAVPCAAMFWLSSPQTRRRLVCCIPVAGIAFYVLAGAMVVGREHGTLNFGARPTYIGHEMYRELLFIIEHVPENHPYLLGQTYLTQLVNPIPRFLWSAKPLGFGVEYAAWHGYDALAGGPNMSPGIIGEMYANFGIVGPVLCSLFGGLLCRAWDRLREQHPSSAPVLMFYTAGLVVVFLAGRSVSIGATYPLVAAYFCLVLALGLRHRARSDEPVCV